MPGVANIICPVSGRVFRRFFGGKMTGFALVGLLAVSLSGAVGEGMEVRPLAARQGGRGPTLFADIPPAQSGLFTENNYADPKMWGDLYHEYELGTIGTGVTIGDYDAD